MPHLNRIGAIKMISLILVDEVKPLDSFDNGDKQNINEGENPITNAVINFEDIKNSNFVECQKKKKSQTQLRDFDES